MSYTVAKGFSKSILWILAFVLFLSFAIGYTFLIFGTKTAVDIKVSILIYAIFAFLEASSIVMVYKVIRPRVKVRDNELIRYPLWKRKETVKITDINQRRTKNIAGQNTAYYSAGAIGGLAAYFINKSATPSLSRKYYYIDGREIIFIESDFKNADKLDALIRSNFTDNEDDYKSVEN